jgi:DNA-directed RNA polymerase
MHDTLEAMKAESEAGPKGGKGVPKGVPVEAAYTFMQLGPAELTCITLHELTSMLLKQPAGIYYTRSCKIVGKAVEAEYNLALLRANKTVWKDLTRKHKGKDLKEWVINKTARDIGDDGLWEESMVVKVGAWLLDTCIECAVIPPDPKETKEEQEQAVTVMALKKDRVTQKAKKGKGLVNPYIVLCNERVFQVLDSSQTLAEGLFTTHQPMISEPRKWTRSDIGGYLSLKTEVIRTRSRKHMSLVNYADMTQVYDSLNYLGSIPWRINPRVLAVVEALWSAGGGKAGLVPQHDKPLPDPPSMDLTGEEFEEAKKVYNRDMRRVKKENSELHSLRCDTEYKIDVARKFSNRKVFFPANIDFRGRVYPLPPHLNHQGADLSRGLLQFYEGRPLGPNGLRWLKIHMANVSGKDKLPFQARVQWTDDHMEQIRAVVLDPTGQQGEEGLWWLNAEEPLQALATCHEITQALASDNVELFSSHLPVHMDGSCNGLQHYGALGRDKGGGSAVNLMPHDSPQDVYAGVLEIVKQKIEVDAAAGHELAPLLRGKITRKVVKQTVMTSVYGVTLVGAKAQILSRLQELECEWPEPREKILHDCSLYLAKLSLSSLGVLFKSAQEIMAWLAELCRLVTKQGQHMSWITPLGLPVIQPYVKEKDYQVKTLKHRLTIADARVLPVSSQRQKSAFPPNFVHSLDATHMFMTTLDCKEKGLHFSSVHDSYWTHAGTMETMNASLREQFVDLYSQPILEDLLALLEMRFPLLEFPPVPQRGELDLELVKKSEYFFA